MENKVILEALDLVKTFSLSRKQQQLEKTKTKVKVAVNHLSFQVYEGEIYGLLGPNGAGKTTTLRMLSTLIKPTSGSALVNGFDIIEESDKVRNNICFLTSELKFEDFFTPNYLFDFFAKLHGLSKEETFKNKEKLFTTLGINEFKEVKIGELSTGMKQKVAIAISLAHDPKIIIFDEPTNGLDVLTAKVVTDYLLELKKEGRTIIVSTHIFSLVEKICDRVGVIINGEMVLQEGVKTLIKEKNLEDIFFELYKEKVGEQQ